MIFEQRPCSNPNKNWVHQPCLLIFPSCNVRNDGRLYLTDVSKPNSNIQTLILGKANQVHNHYKWES